MTQRRILFATLFVIASLSAISAQTACSASNQLRSLYGLTSLTTSTSLTATPPQYCKGIKGGAQSCCSADTINGFNTLYTNELNSITGIMKQRDQYLVGVRDNTLPQLSSTLTQFNTLSKAVFYYIGNQTGQNISDLDSGRLLENLDGGRLLQNSSANASNSSSGAAANSSSNSSSGAAAANSSSGAAASNSSSGAAASNSSSGAAANSSSSNSSANAAAANSSNSNNGTSSGNNTNDNGGDDVSDNSGPLGGFAETPVQIATAADVAGQGYNPIDFSSLSTDTLASIEVTILALQGIGSVITSQLSSLKSGYGTYQSSRATCITQLLNLQNAAYCLACSPTNQNGGYDASTNQITLSSRVCTRLQNACYTFLTQSAAQNLILTTASYGTLFTTTTANLVKLLHNDTTGANGFSADTLATNTTTTVNTPSYEAAAYFPDNCNSATDCNWICDNLFDEGVIQQNTLVAGGDLANGNTSRLLQDATLRSRNLQAADDFDPDTDESGIVVTVPTDPGNTASGSSTSTSTTTKSASLLKNAMMAAVVVIAALMA